MVFVLRVHPAVFCTVVTLVMLISVSVPFYSLASSLRKAKGDDQQAAPPAWDSNGYILYCPCMGRLGNQMDQFLGTLQFAKEVNRTLILPNHIDFKIQNSNGFFPWNTFFDQNRVADYHRVVSTHDFMTHLAGKHWPADQRTYICYDHARAKPEDCTPRRGNPSTRYWDKMSEYLPDHEQLVPSKFEKVPISFHNNVAMWEHGLSADKFPVVWIFGALGEFPVAQHKRHLQEYVQWTSKLVNKAKMFIRQRLKRPFVAIHMRNGEDWKNACKHAVGTDRYMESPQCMDGSVKHISAPKKVTEELCMGAADAKRVSRETQAAVVAIKAKSVFVATDDKAHMKELRSALTKDRTGLDWDVKVVRYGRSDDKGGAIEEELPVLELADYFVGSCVSSVTGFVTRRRSALNTARERLHGGGIDIQNGELPSYPSTFFGVKTKHKKMLKNTLDFHKVWNWETSEFRDQKLNGDQIKVELQDPIPYNPPKDDL